MTFLSDMLGALRTAPTFPFQGPGRNEAGLTPCCVLQHTTDWSAANNTLYTLGTTSPAGAVFETVAKHSGGMRATGFPGRIYLRDAGAYAVDWGIEYAASAAAGGRLARLLRNGAQVFPEGNAVSPAVDATFSVYPRGSTKIVVNRSDLSAGVYLEVAAFQITGGALTVINAHLSATLVANA